MPNTDRGQTASALYLRSYFAALQFAAAAIASRRRKTVLLSSFARLGVCLITGISLSGQWITGGLGGSIYTNSSPVGIGMNPPQANGALWVNGNVLLAAGSGNMVSVGNGNNGGSLDFNPGGVSSAIRLAAQNGGNQLWLSNSGNIGIGSYNSSSLLTVNGGLSVGAGYGTQPAPPNGAIVQGYLGVGTVAPQYPLTVASSGVYQGQIYQSGTGPGAYTVLRIENNDAPGAVAYIGLGGQTVGNGAMRNTAFFGTQTPHAASIFTNDTPRLTVTPAGSVGVGTTNPAAKLDVNGDVKVAGGIVFSDQSRMTTAPSFSLTNGNALFNLGNVGIGTSSPPYPLTVASAGIYQGQLYQTGSGVGAYTVLRVENNDAPGVVGYLGLGGQAVGNQGMRNTAFFGTQTPHAAAIFTNDLPRLTVTAGGSVGIATSSPCVNTVTTAPCRLSVAGAITAQEIVVSATGADYVFDTGYKLAPLADVAAYTRANHRLPEMPSASEMTRNGLNVGDMQVKLLAKLEELTLHAISAERRSAGLERRNDELQAQNAALAQRLEAIEQLLKSEPRR